MSIVSMTKCHDDDNKLHENHQTCLIWPNQKRILGLVDATEAQIAKGKVVALMASRTNTLLSIPMLMCMSSHMHGLPL